jgi:hypothetical protein
MTITRSNRMSKSKTKKHNITKKRKQKFIHDIIANWKKIGGGVTRDTTTIYKYDYYLTIGKSPDYNNHIHLVLKHFQYDHNKYDNLVYVMKKCRKNKIIHSKSKKISIFSDPKIIVKHMFHNYKNFIN